MMVWTNSLLFGQVDDCLEEGLALQLQAQVGEPGRQQQRDGDLRDEADDPEQQRVAKVFGQVGCKQGDVVLQAHKGRADDLQAAAVIFKKAVIDRRPQWDELEHRKDEEERCNEDIAPLCIADRAVLLWFCSHSNCPPDVHCPKQNGAGGISVRPAPFRFGSKGFQVPAALMRARPHRSARGTFP